MLTFSLRVGCFNGSNGVWTIGIKRAPSSFVNNTRRIGAFFVIQEIESTNLYTFNTIK